MKSIMFPAAFLTLLATTALAGTSWQCGNSGGCNYEILVDGNWQEREMANTGILVIGDDDTVHLGTGWTQV